MTPVERSWPVRLITAGSVPLTIGAVAWRAQAALEGRLTVIVKATFALVSEGPMRPHAPEPFVVADVHYGGDPRHSLQRMSDLAPYRAQAEVVLHGHVYAPPGRPVQVGGARLFVHRGGSNILVRKTVNVHGDRVVDAHGRISEPVPFQQMPLMYERAVFHAEWNPVGRTGSGERAANLISAEEPSRPGCFGPIPAHWPGRARFLHGLDPRSLVGTMLELPRSFDWGFYLAAPKDQRLDFLQGDEGIMLGGMHPVVPMLRTHLPGVRAQARVFRGPDTHEPLDLWGDTLTIDVDTQLATVVFRSNVPFMGDELSSMVVVAGLALPDVPLVLPSTVPVTRAVSAPSAALSPVTPIASPKISFASEQDKRLVPEDDEQLTGTLFGPLEAPVKPALPFTAGGVPALPSTPSDSPSTSPVVLDDEQLTGTLFGPLEAPVKPALPFTSGGAPARPPPAPPPRMSPTPPALPFVPSAPGGAAFGAQASVPTQASEPAKEQVPVQAPPAPPIPRRTTDAITVFGTTQFALVTLPWQVRPPQDSLTVVVKGSCAIVPNGSAEWLPEPSLPIGDVHVDDDPDKGVVYPSDFAIFKPKADVLLVGQAVAAGGSSPAGEVTFRFGRGKALFFRRAAVFGERSWEKSLVSLAPTPPRPFTTIPMRWERAFGGPRYQMNPAGIGHKAAAGPDGVARLPNFEDPQHLIESPSDTPRPVCFGPTSPRWHERWSRIGTYGDSWLEKRWPYFPEDFDWFFFQAAPQSQQLEWLEGDEPFEVTGMHPHYPLLRGSLPGARPRCFMQRAEQAGGSFEELILRLDSVVIDIEAMKIDLVFRGNIEVSDEDAPEIAAFFLTNEPLAGKRLTLEQARQAFHAALTPHEVIEESYEFTVEPENDAESESEDDPILAAIEVEAAAREKQIRETMARAGIDGETPPAAQIDPQAVVERMREVGASPEDIAAILSVLEPAVEEEMETTRDHGVRAMVEALLAEGASLEGLELENADLEDLDFSGRSLSGASLRGSSLRRARFVKTNLTGTLLSRADLTAAVLDGANLELSDLEGACLDEASFNGATVTSVNLSEARGMRASFREARGEGAVFAQGTWTNARFDNANLPGADFTASQLAGAVFADAALPDVILYDVEGPGASFDGASMPDARVDGASLPRANFRKVFAPGSVWERATLDQASFIGATLTASTMVRASCVKTNFSGADLTEAILRRAKLPEAQLFKANLHLASLERADLTRADLRNANLHAAGLWKAKMRGADTDFAILTKTLRRTAT